MKRGVDYASLLGMGLGVVIFVAGVAYGANALSPTTYYPPGESSGGPIVFSWFVMAIGVTIFFACLIAFLKDRSEA